MINKHLKSFDKIALYACCITFILWAVVLLRKYICYLHDDWDLAAFSQAFWNISNGNSNISLFGKSIFGIHSCFIIYIFLPFYFLFQHPLFLVFLKLSSFISSGFMIYLFGKKYICPKTGILCLILFFCYPPNIFGIFYEFHFESIAPFFLLLLLYFYTEKRLFLFFLTTLSVLLIKENMSLIIITLGIYSLFSKSRNKLLWGAIPITIGIVYFFLMTHLVIPYFNSGEQPLLSRYVHLGQGSISHILISILTNPIRTINIVIQKPNLKFLFDILAPLGFFPLGSPKTLFIISPIVLQHLLSSNWQEKSIYYYYVLTISPFLYLATILFLKTIKTKTRPHIYNLMISGLIFFHIFALFRDCANIYYRINPRPAPEHIVSKKKEFINSIPDKSSVIATFNFLPELSQREYLYSFHQIYHPLLQVNWTRDLSTGRSYLPKQKKENHIVQAFPTPIFNLPPNNSYALIDFSDRWLIKEVNRNKLYSQTIHNLIERHFEKENWSFKKAANNTVLFEKSAGKKNSLVRLEDKSISSGKNDPFMIGKNFSLNHMDAVPVYDTTSKYIKMSFHWQCFIKMENNYSVIISLKKDDKRIHQVAHMIGYALQPTTTWKEGNHIYEDFYFLLPKLKSGYYDIDILTVNKSISFPEELANTNSYNIYRNEQNLLKLSVGKNIKVWNTLFNRNHALENFYIQ